MQKYVEVKKEKSFWMTKDWFTKNISSTLETQMDKIVDFRNTDGHNSRI